MSVTRVLLSTGLAFSAALTLVSTAAAQVSPRSGGDPAATRIAYRDADIHTTGGARRLAFRLKVAAAGVCGGDDIIIRTGDAFARCQAATVRHAASELGAPLVTEALGLSPVTFAGR